MWRLLPPAEGTGTTGCVTVITRLDGFVGVAFFSDCRDAVVNAWWTFQAIVFLFFFVPYILITMRCTKRRLRSESVKSLAENGGY